MKAQTFARIALASTMLTSATQTALADDNGGWSSDGVPAWSNPDTGDEFKFRGRIYLDAADVTFTTNGVDTEFDDTEIRTARLGITGRFSSVRYVAEFDWINESIKANDVSLTFNAGDFSVTVGHLKTPNSLEEQTSSRYITFMERGTGTDLFGIDRRVGVAIATGGDNYSFKAGLFGGRLGDLSDSLDIDDSSAFAARATFAPVKSDEMTVHVGASVRYLDYGDAGTRLRARPRTHITPRIVTADFRPGRPLGEADTSMFWGLEGAAISGPVHVHAEYMRQEIDGSAGNSAFDSAFINAGWFLTGETRSYSASSGRFGRTRPSRPLSEGGFGAWEIAVRYDTSDLNEVSAGELTTWTAGVNWYLEDHIRIMGNVVDGELTVPGAADTEVSGVQMRLQWDF